MFYLIFMVLILRILVFFLKNGTLRYFYLEDWEVVNEFHHLVGISMISPDSMGTKVAFIDEKGDGFLYNPIADVCSELTSFPRAVLSILWETFLSDKVGLKLHIFC